MLFLKIKVKDCKKAVFFGMHANINMGYIRQT